MKVYVVACESGVFGVWTSKEKAQIIADEHYGINPYIAYDIYECEVII